MNLDLHGTNPASRSSAGRLAAGAAAVSLLAGGCQTPGALLDPARLLEIVSDGPVDGSAAITFVVPAFFEPVVTVAADVALAEEGEPFAPDRDRAEHVKQGANRYELTIDGVEAVQAEQQDDAWCWAACAQMVNAHRGRPLISRTTGAPATQAELARYYKGDAEDQTANLALIIRSLAPELEAELCAQRVTLGASLRMMSTDALIEGMSRGELAVLGLEEDGGGGHACVVIGVEYGWVLGGAAIVRARASAGENREAISARFGGAGAVLESARTWGNALAVHELTVFDPWGAGSVRTISGRELAERCRFLMTPSLAREILATDRQESLAGALGRLESELEEWLD